MLNADREITTFITKNKPDKELKCIANVCCQIHLVDKSSCS